MSRDRSVKSVSIRGQRRETSRSSQPETKATTQLPLEAVMFIAHKKTDCRSDRRYSLNFEGSNANKTGPRTEPWGTPKCSIADASSILCTVDFLGHRLCPFTV